MRRAFRDGIIGLEEAPGLLDALPLPVVISRISDHSIVAVNEAACDFLARPAEQLKRLTVDDITAPTDAADIPSDYRTLATEGLVKEKRYLRGDGETVRGRVHGVLLTGDPEFAAVAILDTTGLHASLERLDALASVAGLIHRVGSDPHAFVTALRQLLREELGIDVGVEWDEETAHLAETWFADASPLEPTRPINVLGRTVGRLDVRFPPETIPTPGLERWTSALTGLVGAASVVSELADALRAARLFEAGFESSSVGLQLVTPEGVFLRVNDAFAEMVGRTPEELVGTNWRDVTAPEHLGADTAATATLVGGLTQHRERKRYVRPDGSMVWGDVTITVVVPDGVDPAGERVHLTQVIDITDQVEASETERTNHRKLAASELRQRSLLDTAPDAVLRVSADGTITGANQRIATMFGQRRPDDLLGRSVAEILPIPTADLIHERAHDVLATGRQAEVWRHWIAPLDRPAGWYLLRFVPEPADPSEGDRSVHVVASEITELVENEQRLANLALVDPLTGVSNRAAIFDRLQHALDRLARHGGGIAVAICDLDHFKAINDTFGHATGDEALRAVAARLGDAVRGKDTVGRLGGDEFIVIFEDVADQAAAEELGERLASAVASAEVLSSDGNPVRTAGSVGVAWTTSTVQLRDLIGRADRAMYQAKRHGRGRVWAETRADTVQRSSSDVTLLRDLQGALDRQQFELHYQPIVDVRARRVVAVEALLRWNHPDGPRPPSAFLGTLVESGRIGPVGRWAMATAVDQLVGWRRLPGLEDLSIHVNVSLTELAALSYSSDLRSTLDDAGVPASAVCIEITEPALAGTVISSSVIAEVASTGVQIVLDDFGTGVSSLAQLRSKPLHGIKVDRSFVAGADDDPAMAHIAAAIVALGAPLGLEVTAEGVETPGQAEWLTSLGCHRQQGRAYAPAVPASEIPDLVRSLESGPSS